MKTVVEYIWAQGIKDSGFWDRKAMREGHPKRTAGRRLGVIYQNPR